MNLEEILWRDFLRNYPPKNKQDLTLSDYLLLVQHIIEEVNQEFSADSIDFFINEGEGLLEQWRKELSEEEQG